MKSAIHAYWQNVDARKKQSRPREQSGQIDKHATGPDRHRPEQIASWDPQDLSRDAGDRRKH